jgi:hypothetical protein
MSLSRDLWNWLPSRWPNRGNRRAIADAYLALKHNRLLLADIALRGSVFTGNYTTGLTPFDAGVAEGRRQFALEIIRAAEEDPHGLYPLIERAYPKPT